MKYLLTLIGSVLLFAACNKDDDGPDFTRQKATRAVMVYMAGENNLTSHSSIKFLKNDLQEIVEGSKLLTDNQRLFVFVDSLGTDPAHKGTPYIIEVHGGKTYERNRYSTDFYSCDPDKFRDIVSWMTSNVQADGYALVLWGHATGWVVESDSLVSSRRAYGQDTGADSGTSSEKWMNITQMAEALKGLPKLDYIFADCCNMMCAEVGYELRNVTDYLIGSPAEIPGNGAPYDLMVPHFFKSGSALYKGIIDTYYDYYTAYYNQSTSSSLQYLKGYSVPLAVIDTKHIEQLAQQTHDVLSTFVPDYPNAVGVSGIPYYFYQDAPVMFDLRGIVKLHATAADFAAWDAVYSQAVPYYRMSMRWMTSSSHLLMDFSDFNQDASSYGCVSMFVPFNTPSYHSGEHQYNKLSRNFAWTRAMQWERFGW